MFKILITGGAGFIGYHLALHLLKKNKHSRLVLADNLSRGVMDKGFKTLIKNPRVKFLKLDLTDPESLRQLGSGYKKVYHLAAINGTKNFYEMPHEVLRINTLLLINMLEWMKNKNRGGKFLFTSSNEAYAGALESFGKLPIPTPENVPLVVSDAYNPRWSYATTKLIGELFVIHYALKYGFRALVVRPHNFYGPRAGFSHVIPEFSIRVAKKIDPFPIFGAEDSRAFCYIDDAVRAMRMLMDSPKTDKKIPETVHIGDCREIKIMDLAGVMFKLAGWKPKKVIVKDSPQGSVRRRLADITKIKNLVGWKPKVSLEEGLKTTYFWYRDKTHES